MNENVRRRMMRKTKAELVDGYIHDAEAAARRHTRHLQSRIDMFVDMLRYENAAVRTGDLAKAITNFRSELGDDQLVREVGLKWADRWDACLMAYSDREGRYCERVVCVHRDSLSDDFDPNICGPYPQAHREMVRHLFA